MPVSAEPDADCRREREICNKAAREYGLREPHPKLRSVVIVTPWFPNRPGDRNGSFVFESAAALARRGLAVHVLVCRPYVPRALGKWAPEWMRGTVETGRFADFASLETLR